MNNSKGLLEIYDEIKDSLSMSVKIDHVQISKVVLNDLIPKRNASTGEMQECFDKIIKAYYLSGEEFEKYVVRKETLE